MNAAVDFPGAWYAVIEVLQTETGHENIVIAYPNEKTLREAFAASSIVAFGFGTRGEAVVAGATSFPTAVADPRLTEAMTPAESNKPAQGLNWAEPQKEIGSVMRRLRRFLATSWSDVVTSAVVLLASTSTVSAAIRMAMGSPV